MSGRNKKSSLSLIKDEPKNLYADLKAYGHSVSLGQYNSNWVQSMSMGTVVAAINHHASGNFNLSAAMWEWENQNIRLASVVNARIDGLLASVQSIESVGKTPEEQILSGDLATKLEEDWFTMVPETELRQLLFWYIGLGVAIGELIVDKQPTEYKFKLKVWHPSCLRYDIENQIYILTTKSGEFKIDPNKPTGDWILLCGSHLAFRQAACVAVAETVVSSNWNKRDASRHQEKHGLPITVLGAPAQSPGPDKESFVADASRLQGGDIVLCPTSPEGSFTISLLESNDKYDGFVTWKQVLDVDFSVYILGQNLTTEIGGGSRSAAEVHQDIKNQCHLKDANILTSALREQLIKFWVLANFESDLNLAPWIKFQVLPPDDLNKSAATYKAVADAISGLKSTGLRIDLNALAAQFNIPLLPEEEVKVEETDTSNLILTPSDLASVVSVNEARQSTGLGPLTLPDGSSDPDGELTLPEFQAKKQAVLDAQAAQNILPSDPAQDTPDQETT